MMILRWNKDDKGLSQENRKPIYIYVNSSGGDVILGMNILDVIKNSITPVITVGFGICASMASYILASGHIRYCFNNTWFRSS